MRTNDKDGVRAGKYKITIAKTKAPVSGLDDPNMTATEKMEKAMKAGGGGPPGAGGGPPGGGPKMGGGGPRPGGGAGGPGGGAGPGGKSTQMGFKQENELPVMYASADKTPFTTDVPAKESPIKLELKKQ